MSCTDLYRIHCTGIGVLASYFILHFWHMKYPDLGIESGQQVQLH